MTRPLDHRDGRVIFFTSVMRRAHLHDSSSFISYLAVSPTHYYTLEDQQRHTIRLLLLPSVCVLVLGTGSEYVVLAPPPWSPSVSP